VGGIVHERRGMRRNLRRGRIGAQRDGERGGRLGGGGQRRERGYRSDVPDAVGGIGDGEILVVGTGRVGVRRAGAVLGAVGTVGKDVQVRGHRAAPRVVERERGRVRLVEGRRGRRQDDGQIEVVAHPRRAEI